MSLHPHGAGGDAFGPAHRDEQAGELLAVAPAVGERAGRPLEIAIAVFHLLAARVVEGLHFLPAVETVARVLRELHDLGMP